MTPELRQAITILQLSSIELSEYIEQEILNNPVLEIKEDSAKENNDDLEDVKLEDKEDSKEEIDWEEYFQTATTMIIKTVKLIMIKKNIHTEFYNKSTYSTGTSNFSASIKLTSEEYMRIGEFLIRVSIGTDILHAAHKILLKS